ncbi:MAG: GWxTD domain-containing protein [Bacteroidia bacterium]|nr:GWxTD domain-containing protein [Bacteroidia bacterium]
MRNIYVFLVCLFVSLATVRAGNVWMFLDVCQYSNLEGNPYIETYISIDGSTVSFVPGKNGKFQGTVNILYFLYKINDKDSALIQGDNFNLISLEAEDSLESTRRSKPFRYIKRTQLSEGKYRIVAEATDIHAPNAKPSVALYEFEVKPSAADDFSFSDIEFISSFAESKDESSPYFKNGFEIIPFNTNGFYLEREQLNYYVEMYHSDKVFSNAYFVRTQILRDEKILFEYTKTHKKPATSFDILTGNFNISKLPSDAYELVIEVLGEKNNVIKRVSRRFDVLKLQNDRPLTLAKDNSGVFDKYSEEELSYYIRTMQFISNSSEVSMAKSLENLTQKKDYLYSFWQKRVDAEAKGSVDLFWGLHLKKVEYANQQYKATNTEGWRTDRGRVLMKYGKPNGVESFPAESGLLPYEIWRYDRLETQSAVIFVFCDTDQATGTYELLHSSKYGEVKNPRWRDFIQGNARARNKATIDYEDRNQMMLDSKLNPNAGIGDH